MQLTRVFPILLAAAMTGCASAPSATNAVADDQTHHPSIVVIERGRLVKADDMICHWEAKTGTRLQKKVCLTRAQRALLAEESQQFLKKIQHNATIAPNR